MHSIHKAIMILKSFQDSLSSRQESSSVWEQYEAGIYRKPHLNEKAFGGTLRQALLESRTSMFINRFLFSSQKNTVDCRSNAAKETNNTTLNRNGSAELATQTVEATVSNFLVIRTYFRK